MANSSITRSGRAKNPAQRQALVAAHPGEESTLPNPGEFDALSLDEEDIASVIGVLKPNQVARPGRSEMAPVSAPALALWKPGPNDGDLWATPLHVSVPVDEVAPLAALTAQSLERPSA